ncbi:hypothetical protein SAMD00019534_111740 [Acytostelium subglobosum LB1]|uniref:hypothetical protein n=1 Tax=Acytostelium subglobosum LB1 TaxID=1410327 RepID=UPI00064486A2|nr:hypothetical protein SAMD00019534_111740 [Acytostelium subglobosum LB1]GAM27998.1 hypothetical protein SAMD00019534_111740 [Acytostelium subglobosum LB1]|eukprot:XP_012748957.1 hypothetical protein SAMD00019534_111740 [Acytostelium subglobosum LB1]
MTTIAASTKQSMTTGGGASNNKGGEWNDVTKTGVVLFPFNASHKFQLPLSVGDLVQIHSQTAVEGDQGWFSGVSITTQESGIFPQSYVVILPDTVDEATSPHHVPISTRLNIPNEQFTNCAILNEITTTIVEWATLLKIFSQNKQHNDFKTLTHRITQLVQFRNQLLTLSSPKEITFELRDKIIHLIDEGRQETGMKIVLRKEMSNPHSVASSNPRNSNVSLHALAATDLILADAENSGVFALCTMYQEKRQLISPHEANNRQLLDSAKKEEATGPTAGSAVTGMALNGSTGTAPGSQSPAGGSGSGLNISPSTSSGSGIGSGLSGSGSLPKHPESPIANGNGSPQSAKKNFLSSVRIKGKMPTNSLTGSGGMPPLPVSAASASTPNLHLHTHNGLASTSAQSLANSHISLTSSPPSTAPAPTHIPHLQSQLSLLNLSSAANNTTPRGARGGQPPLMLKPGKSLKTSQTLDGNSKCQLVVSLNNFLYSSGEYLELVLSVYSKTEGRFLTENYCGIVPPSGIFVEPESPQDKIRTIFKDLEPRDLHSELYLVAKIYRRTTNINSKDPNSSPTMTRSNASMMPSAMSLNTSSSNAFMQTIVASGSSNKHFKKYIGCGVKRLDLLNSVDTPVELLITLYTSSNETSLATLHDSIIAEATTTYEPITRAKGIVCTVQHFFSDYAQFLFENAPYRSVTASLKMHLPEVMLPGYDRNDLYLQFEDGEFSDKNIEVTVVGRSNDTGHMISDSIKFANGQPELSEYRTSVQASPSSRWNESIKVWMSAKSFANSHLLFTVRSCSEKKDKERQTIGFGFLRFLNDDGCMIKDGAHTINIYRAASDDIPLASYINGVVTDAKSSSSKKLDTLRVRTSFVSVCHTQSPQVVHLSKWQSFQGELSTLIKDITFLNQQDLIRNLQEIFYNFLAIMDQQLHDSPLSMEIFKALIFIIGVLVDSRTVNFRPALDMYISKYFGLSLNPSGSPAGIAAHSHLLRSVVKNLENFQDPANASKISSSLKALEYVFKMVIASRSRFPNKVDANVNNENYQNNLKSVVDILCEIMISNSPSLIGAQTIALKNFEGMFSDLKRFFTVEEMGIIALKFMKSIQHLEKNKTFNMLKLKLLSSYLHGELMLNKDTRRQLHPIVFQLLQLHFGKSIEETEVCLTVLGQITDIMITKSEIRADKDTWLMDVMTFFVQILELLQLINVSLAATAPTTITPGSLNKRRSSSSSYLNGASASVSLASMVSSLGEESQVDLRLKIYAFILGTARLAGIQHWEMFSKTVSSKTFFIDLFDSLQNLFDSPKIPGDFWTFTVFKMKTLLRMTRILEDVIFYQSSAAGTKVAGQFEFALWRSFFLMTSSYLNSKDLQLESVNPAKAVYLKSRCGDVRIEMARVIERVWNTVPLKEKASFIPVLVDPIIKLYISDSADAKRLATRILYDMLEGEITLNGGHAELISKTVDSLLECGTSISDGMTWPLVTKSSDGKLPFTQKTFATVFSTQSMQLVLSKTDEEVRIKAERFIVDVTHFINLLTTFMNDVKNQDEEEIFASVSKLIMYFQENKRTNHFIRFASMCSKRHFTNGNFIESAVAVMLHANLYQWDHNKVVNAINCDYAPFPAQKESERKEILYKEVLACYNTGKAWDRAIPLLKELTHHFTMNICDMVSAATYLRQQAAFIQKINETESIFEEYFRVGYYGKKFPASIQNKEFIYKGNEFDRLSDFIARTCEKWPKAELLKSTDTPSQSIMDSDSQYLLITTVNISSMGDIQKRHSLNYIGESFSSKKRVPLRVQQLSARNKVNVFLYSKPFKRAAQGTVAGSASKSTNEFEDLWLMNIYLITETHFPCTERRSLVVDRHQYEVSPIENALNSVVQKNEELMARIEKYGPHTANNTQPDSINPLTMTLNGIIDAAVNGGISRYDHFLTNQYLQKHPDNKHFAELLKVAMDQQLVHLEHALKLHGQLRSTDMAAMHDKLESIFNTMRNERTALM